jgi:hypothetical protein
MMRLTLGIVAKTLFDADVDSEAAEIGDAMTRRSSRSTTRCSLLRSIWTGCRHRQSEDSPPRATGLTGRFTE